MWHACEATHRSGAGRRSPATGENDPNRPCDLPTIAAALSDPVIRAMMAADGVNPRQLERTLKTMARKLASQGRLGEASRP
jgi:hypothetical protein